jgi:cysteine desulfurase
MGLAPERIRGSVRFGLGRFNTEAEIDRAAQRVVEEVKRLRLVAEGGGIPR